MSLLSLLLFYLLATQELISQPGQRVLKKGGRVEWVRNDHLWSQRSPLGPSLKQQQHLRKAAAAFPIVVHGASIFKHFLCWQRPLQK